MNLIALVLVLLHDFGLVDFGMDKATFLFLISALLIFTLSVEMIKSAAFALSGAVSWLDFIVSLLLLLGIIAYMIYMFVKEGTVPSPEWWLVAEAQLMDVIVGFYITTSNARRDIDTQRI